MHPTVEKYFTAQEELLEYFGMDSSFDFDNCTDYSWYLTDDSVVYAEDEEELEGDYYSNEIYGKRIYRKEEHTAVVVFYGFGGKYIMVLDNAREVNLDD